MTGRGWTAKDLPLVGDDPKLWTVAQAAALLGPPRLSIGEVRIITKRMEPVGKRRTAPAGQPGRCARVYNAADFITAYERWSRAV